MELKRGTQIIYETEGKYEEGFVTSVDEDMGFAWCRYWRRAGNILRTLSVSEMTPISKLRVEETRSQELVDQWLERLTPTPCEGCTRDCRTAFPACQKAHTERSDDANRPTDR